MEGASGCYKNILKKHLYGEVRPLSTDELLQETKAAHEALVGALRREETARQESRRLEAELMGLKELLDQKEQDVQRSRMIIRLKDARLEVRCLQNGIHVS